MSLRPIDMRALEGVLGDLEEAPTPPFQLIRLDGGYSWQTYRVLGSDGRAVILRLAPDGGTMEPYDPQAEARVIASVGGKVPVPPVLVAERSAERLGAPFSVQGELRGATVRPSTPVADRERDLYREAFSAALGRIHSVSIESPSTITEALRDELQTSYGHYLRTTPWVHPGFEIGYRWLRARIPVSNEPAVLCHGDFRLANLLWSAAGELTGVLDWERAWVGDPMADVAFTRLFSGWCCVSDDAVTTYEREAGLEVDEARLEYALRFERWRSFTSSVRGLRAFMDGRNRDPGLLAIGLAGDAGAWDLVDWLEPDLPPLVDDNMVPATDAPHLPGDWLTERAPVLFGRLTTADEHSRSASLEALRSKESSVPGLREALVGSDPDAAWNGAFTCLAQAARTGSGELIPTLKALALRAKGRPNLRARDLRREPQPSSGVRGVI
jgi:aminoglycoside phosphotransferase (APT) family kinase protein